MSGRLLRYRVAVSNQFQMDRVLNSRTGLAIASSLSRSIPPLLGYTLANLVAKIISRRKNSPLVSAIRLNQWVVTEGNISRKNLDLAVQTVLRNTACSIYELYHYIHNPETAGKRFTIEPSFAGIASRAEFEARGLVVAGLHMNGFDLALRWICLNGLKPLALTIPNPDGGRQMEFEIRKNMGLNLVPGSVSGLRQAMRHLQQGGLVVTGVDRPIGTCRRQPSFFGQRASLPVHHIQLALKAQVPVVIVVSRIEDDGKYHLRSSIPIEMDRYPARETELLKNAEKVLEVAEGFIRQTPQQWLISQPVWAGTPGIIL